MISCIIVDDEPSALDVLRIHSSKIESVKVLGEFSDPFKARDFLKNNPVDLVLLDINMPGLSGLQILDQLSNRPLVVFTTAYSEYAVDSYDYMAVDYLLKPIEFDKFSRAINRVQEALESKNQNGEPHRDFLFLKDGYKQIKVFIQDIEHIQSDGNYLNVFSGSKRINTRMTLNQILELLPKLSFVRVHNSHVVNVEQIDRVENNQIIIGEAKIGIGPSYREVLHDILKFN